MTDLVVTGGTVVTARGSRRADVAVAGGRIEAVGEGLARDGARTLDAHGLLVLPGAVDVHTHTRLPSDGEPDRFFRDSVAAAFGGTTTFLCFDNPGTGISDAGALDPLEGVREFRSRTEGESAVDYGVSAVLTGDQADPIGAIPGLVDAGVPTFKAFTVYDFRLDEPAIGRALAAARDAGGMLQVHCEDASVVDGLVAAALEQGSTAPRFHAVTRPTSAEADATRRILGLAAAADAPVYVVHLSCAAALREVRAAKDAGVRAYAETCPHYLALTDERYDEPDPALCARSIISPPLRTERDRGALWAGLGAGFLDLVATDHVPDRADREKSQAARGVSFDRISNGAPGIETLLRVVHTEGVATGRIAIERMVDVLATTPARLFGLHTKGAIEPGRDADLVLFDPDARGTLRAADLHHTSDYTPYEGREVAGAVRSVLSRGELVVHDGRFVGRRGAGRFLERSLASAS
jgi:dihydropyrimidinase